MSKPHYTWPYPCGFGRSEVRSNGKCYDSERCVAPKRRWPGPATAEPPSR